MLISISTCFSTVSVFDPCFPWTTIWISSDQSLSWEHFCDKQSRVGDDDIHFCLLGENRWAALAEKCHTKCKYSTLLFMCLRLFWLFLLFPSALKEHTLDSGRMTTIIIFFFGGGLWPLRSREIFKRVHTYWRQTDLLTEDMLLHQSASSIVSSQPFQSVHLICLLLSKLKSCQIFDPWDRSCRWLA